MIPFIPPRQGFSTIEGMDDMDEEGMDDMDEEGFENLKEGIISKKTKNKIKNEIKEFKKKIRNNVHYLTAKLITNDSNNTNNNNGKSQLLYKKISYTFTKICIVGKTSKNDVANANLIISLNAINNKNNGEPINTAYVIFPLIITKDKNKKNANPDITNLLTITNEKNKKVSIDFKTLLTSNIIKKGQSIPFDIYEYKDKVSVEKINVNIFVCSKINEVFYPLKLRWINEKIQKIIGNTYPINLSTLKAALNPKNKIKEGFSNKENFSIREPLIEGSTGMYDPNLFQEEQIYIQCAPAGASTQTKAVKVDAKKSSKKDTDNLSLLISVTVIIMVNILVIGIGYTSIYGLLSRFFVRNVIENGHHKRRDSPLSMFLMWMLDNGPHFEFMNSLWNGQTRTSSEKLIRVFVFAFYTIILVMILYGYNKKGKRNLVHLAFYILFIYIADIFFFFIQIHNMSIQQYESLKVSSEK